MLLMLLIQHVSNELAVSYSQGLCLVISKNVSYSNNKHLSFIKRVILCSLNSTRQLQCDRHLKFPQVSALMSIMSIDYFRISRNPLWSVPNIRVIVGPCTPIANQSAGRHMNPHIGYRSERISGCAKVIYWAIIMIIYWRTGDCNSLVQ